MLVFFVKIKLPGDPPICEWGYVPSLHIARRVVRTMKEFLPKGGRIRSWLPRKHEQERN